MRRTRTVFSVMRCALLLVVLSTAALAQGALRAPPDLLGAVGFDQHLGADLPAGSVFRDAHGIDVRLGALLADRPTLLVPAYYRCTNLCSVVRAGVADAVGRSGLVPGRDFAVVLVSFDPRESPQDALAAQQVDAAERPTADVSRFQYLTGSQAMITSVMRTIGFRYYFDARNGQFAHDAGIVLLTPGGRVSQYFFGVHFQPEALRLALVNASGGRIGTFVDHFLLLCCDYDASTGRYSVTIQKVLRGLGILTALTLVGLITMLLRAESRRRHALPGDGVSP